MSWEREMARRDKKMQKWKEKRWKRINRRIERGISFLAILITVVFSVLEVLEVLEKEDRRFTLKKFDLNRLTPGNAEKDI